MKRILTILSAVLLIFLAGCSSKDGSKTYVLEKSGVKTEITVYYESDKVTKQTTVNTMDYEKMAVTKDELEAKHYVTEEELNNKAYLTSHQDLSNYALKSEIPQPYNDSTLNERVTALESKAIEGGAYDDSDLRNRVVALEGKEDKDTKYDDTDLRNRVTNLENKPNVDLTNYVTSEQLENKHYLTQHQSLDNLVTKEELNSKGYITEETLNTKGYLTEHQNISHLVTKDELETKGYLTQHQSLEEYAKKSELYNDTEVKQRLTTLENKPNIDTSNFVTNEQLEAKHYLTEHQTLTHLATTSDLEALRNVAVSKSELSKKLDSTEYNSFKDSVVTKTELAEKGYLTTQYDDTDVKNRIQALENRPTTGGTQTQDTGWIKLSDDKPLHGNVVKIRRINDTVHVRIFNENNFGLVAAANNDENDGVYTILEKNIQNGFKSDVSTVEPVVSAIGNIEGNPTHTEAVGVMIYKIQNGQLSIILYGRYLEGMNLHVNEFSYITDEPFPVELQK